MSQDENKEEEKKLPVNPYEAAEHIGKLAMETENKAANAAAHIAALNKVPLHIAHGTDPTKDEMPESTKNTLKGGPDFTATDKQGVTMSVTFPRVLVEILVYGKESNLEAIKAKMKLMQKQLDKPQYFNYARLFYNIVGEDLQAQKKWLIDNSKCKYYVFFPEDKKLEPDFIKELFKRIKRVENAVKHIQNFGIVRHPKKVLPEEEAATSVPPEDNEEGGELKIDK